MTPPNHIEEAVHTSQLRKLIGDKLADRLEKIPDKKYEAYLKKVRNKNGNALTARHECTDSSQSRK